MAPSPPPPPTNRRSEHERASDVLYLYVVHAAITRTGGNLRRTTAACEVERCCAAHVRRRIMREPQPNSRPRTRGFGGAPEIHEPCSPEQAGAPHIEPPAAPTRAARNRERMMSDDDELRQAKRAEVDVWTTYLNRKAREYMAAGMSPEEAEERASADIRREIRQS